MTVTHPIVALRRALARRPAGIAGALVVAGALATGGSVWAQRAPAPAPTGLSADILSLACAPSLVYEAPPTPLRVTGSQESFVHRAFALAVNRVGGHCTVLPQNCLYLHVLAHYCTLLP